MKITALVENTAKDPRLTTEHGLSLHIDRGTKAIGKRLLKHPTRYYTCRCTGLAAYQVLKKTMGDAIGLRRLRRCDRALTIHKNDPRSLEAPGILSFIGYYSLVSRPMYSERSTPSASASRYSA